MKILRPVILALLVSLPGIASAQTSNWTIDSKHSTAQFTVRHMGISNVSGSFTQVSGTAVLNDKDITQSQVNAVIDVNSVDTRVPDRDKDLRDQQSSLRDRHTDVMRRFNELYVFVSRALLGSDIEASIDLTGQGTILLVEDEEGLRALNARGLASRGYTVIEAGNGVEALEELEKQGRQVDVVVSDVVMPEMDGPTLMKELKQRKPDIKIIFVSGYAEDAFDKTLPDHKQFNFLAKPFTLKQLVTVVKETMAG
jgi:CheY-like chemotaxis protein